jgi:hypothetical protein
MAVAKAGDDRTAPDKGRNIVEGGAETLSCFARNVGVSRQGMKVVKRRCGSTSEAKPFSGQTCLIEPANGALSSRERNMAMATDAIGPDLTEHRIGQLTDFTTKAPHIRNLSGQRGLQPQSFSVELADDSSPGGFMAKQTKPLIVEIKRSRKVKAGAQKPSIWGSLDLKLESASDSTTRNSVAPPDIAEGRQMKHMRDPQD